MTAERQFRILAAFKYDHLPEHLQRISKPFHDLAHDRAVDGLIAENEGAWLADTETEAGLRKLLEAKDCFVRAMITGAQ